MSALVIVANKGGCRAIRSIISKWQMHSFRVKIKYLSLFVPRLLMISPHIISVEGFCRKNPIVSVFFVIFSNNTGDWSTDPGARMRAFRPLCKYTGCCAYNSCLRFIRTAQYDTDGKSHGSWGMGGRTSRRKRPKLLGSDDVYRRPTKLYI